MAKDLKFFMREQKDEIVTVPGLESFKDDSGKPIELEIRVLSRAEITKINESYQKRSIALDNRGAPYISNGEIIFKVEKDNARALRHIISEALVYPNLKDEELMKFYNCHDITEMPRVVFSRSDEYEHVSRVVFATLGMVQGANDAETLEAAKN